MKLINKLTTLIFITLLMIGVTGCNMFKEDTKPNNEVIEEEVILNERQKEILAKEGLSTNYDELNGIQKMCIVDIEELLVYLEDKYNIPFEYHSFYRRTLLDPAALYAYPVEGKVEGFPVEVEIIGDEFIDNYLDVYSKWPLEEYLIQNIQPLCPNAKMKIIVGDIFLFLDEIPTDYSKFDGKTSGTIILFIDSETCTKEEFRQLSEEVKQFFNNHRMCFDIRMFYEKPGYIEEIDDYNFSDYFN